MSDKSKTIGDTEQPSETQGQITRKTTYIQPKNGWFSTSYYQITETRDEFGKIIKKDEVLLPNYADGFESIVAGGTMVQSNTIPDLNGPDIDTKLGFDFTSPAPNMLIDFGDDSKLDASTALAYDNSIYAAIAKLLELDPTALTDLQKSIILISILNKYADNGASSRAPGRAKITIKGKTITFGYFTSILGKDTRRWCRTHGGEWYVYRKENMFGMSTRWGRKHGLRDEYAHLGADFLDDVEMNREETRRYAQAKKRATKNNPMTEGLYADLSGSNQPQQIEEY